MRITLCYSILPLRHDKRSLTARGPFLFRARFAARLRTRLEQIFCVLLRLSERSGTIEVHLATLSAQNLRKIFRSMLRDYVYLIGSMPTLIIWLRLSNRFFANFNQAIDYKSIYADIRQPKNYRFESQRRRLVRNRRRYVLLFFAPLHTQNRRIEHAQSFFSLFLLLLLEVLYIR